MNQIRRSLLVPAALVTLFAACGGGDTPTQPIIPVTPPAPVVAGITMTGPTRILVGRTDAVKAVAKTAAGDVVTGKTFTFSSNNTAAVTVDPSGAIHGIAPGTAIISAAVDGVTGTTTVISSDASLVTLVITPPANPVLVGGTTQLAIAGKDSVGQPVVLRTVTWTSSNPNVATVSSTGLVTGRAPGTVTISAEGITNTAIQASVTFAVVPVPVASVVFAAYDSLLHLRFPKQLVAIAKDSAGNTLARPFTYSTSNVDVASLDDFGLVTAQGQGFVTITATSGGKSAQARLFVPSDSGLYVATTGGSVNDTVKVGVDIPGATSPTVQTGFIGSDGSARLNFVTSTGTYRVRAVDITPGLGNVAALIGGNTGNAVTLGPPSTVAVVPMQPYTATITAPTTVAVNSTVTVSWTFSDPAQILSLYPAASPTGTLYLQSTAGADLAGTTTTVTGAPDGNGGFTFTATFPAPAVAGTYYFQVSGDGAFARLLYPQVARGQALKTITVQ